MAPYELTSPCILTGNLFRWIYGVNDLLSTLHLLKRYAQIEKYNGLTSNVHPSSPQQRMRHYINHPCSASSSWARCLYDTQKHLSWLSVSPRRHKNGKSAEPTLCPPPYSYSSPLPSYAFRSFLPWASPHHSRILAPSWCFWTSLFPYPPFPPRVALLERSSLYCQRILMLVVWWDMWHGVLNVETSLNKREEFQEPKTGVRLKAFDLANECERERRREVFEMRMEGDGSRYPIHIFSSSRAREYETAGHSTTFISISWGPYKQHGVTLCIQSLFAVVGPQLTLMTVYDDIMIFSSFLVIDVTVLLMGAKHFYQIWMVQL